MKRIQINNLTVPLDTTIEELKTRAAKKANIRPADIHGFQIARRSVDARRQQIQLNFAVILEIADTVRYSSAAVLLQEAETVELIHGNLPLTSRPVIIGAGPAGLFCAYYLAKHGYTPMIFERGGTVQERVRVVEDFTNGGTLNSNCNIQFGEGGAGTFSDGKLTTRINNPLCKSVLQLLKDHGAPEDILYNAKPHIGTDMLRQVIVNLREEIIRLGGSFLFNHHLEDIQIQNNRVKAVTINGMEIPCQVLILAIGHSSRDTYQMLFEKGIAMEPKAFAMGVRIEHQQSFIDQAQYGRFAGHPALGAADYRLAYNGSSRSCFSFCMCPGGSVVAAASEEQSVVVNGMSRHARDGENANSALVVSVTPKDYSGVLGGINLQRQLEGSAYRLTGSYSAPVQDTEDFLNGVKSAALKHVQPTYPLGYVPTDLGLCLPGFITDTLTEGLLYFDTKIQNFSRYSILTGVETRTSSPVRLMRNGEMESLHTAGLYPIGEGAGYAGGIMSSAVDGIKAAHTVIGKYKEL